MTTMKYKILAFLLACAALTSCIDDLEICADDNDIPAMFTDGYALNIVVTLDNMGGGTRAETTSYGAEKLEELENYIDPEKCRILFFDREERFLFESKSRWVKQLQSVADKSGSYSQWLVSVPLYDYGNDKDWNWEGIRRVLTGEDMQEDLDNYPERKDPSYEYNYDVKVIEKVKKGELQHAFKIAILTNLSTNSWNMGINARYKAAENGHSAGDDILAKHVLSDVDDKYRNDDNPVAPVTPGGWSIHNFPAWGYEDTRWGENTKKVFDMHHCQYDPVYEGKSYSDRGWIYGQEKPYFEEVGDIDWEDKLDERYKDVLDSYWFYNSEIYDFVENVNGTLMTGPVSTWVDWSNEDNTRRRVTINGNSTEYRKFLPLSKSHPIPMYGMQNFDKIENWVKGTPFNLSEIAEGQKNYDFRTISLLRSVVKLELVLPFDPDWVVMWYPNIYAKCIPMDSWTPTEQLWKGKEQDHNYLDYLDVDEGYEPCEWYNLIKYGPTSRYTDVNGDGYKGDDTEFNQAAGIANSDAKTIAKERIAVKRYQQRISWFYGVWSKEGPDGQSRWNFPGYHSRIGIDNTAGIDYPQIFNPCIQRNTTVYCDKDLAYHDEKGMTHYVVYTGERNMNDQSNIVEFGKSTSGAPTICYWMVKHPNGSVYSIALADFDNRGGSVTPTYDTKTLANFTNSKLTNVMGNYEVAVQKGEAHPWPLLRNHVYRIIVDHAPTVPSTPTEPTPESVKWDFTSLSPVTEKYLTLDNTNWQGPIYDDGTEKKEAEGNDAPYFHWRNLQWKSANDKSQLMAGKYHNQVIEETKGLYFSNDLNNSDNNYKGSAANAFNFEKVYGDWDSTNKVWTKWYLRLNKGVKILFPQVKDGQIITIKSLIPVTAGEAAQTGRKIYPVSSSSYSTTFITDGYELINEGRSNSQEEQEMWGNSTTGEVTGHGKIKNKNERIINVFRWKVNTNNKSANVEFVISGNGLAFTEFSITNDDTENLSRTAISADNGVEMQLRTETLYSKSLKYTPPKKTK